ncbi:SPX domain-domain-containing protein [Coniella lustricola]|uniref:SPX domain-domain-containing protein n=1 Tax=Coniella lustricola TaxID=2025994 RepID=A0A2T3AC24_9PEZI|nr:SPX domain-domain-containing protein [Coniella lustricola]
MKFAKELERDLVPEWRIKYLNYKAGKKHIKAITRAISRVNATPSLGLPKRNGNGVYDTPGARNPYLDDDDPQSDDGRHAHLTRSHSGRSSSQPVPVPSNGERQRLTDGAGHDVHYGSIIPTPPDKQNPLSAQSQRASPLELPGPAIRVSSHNTDSSAPRPANTHSNSVLSLSRQALQRTASLAGSYWGTDSDERLRSPERLALPPSGATFPSLASNDIQSPRARLRRMFTLNGSPLDRRTSRGEYDLHALDDVREKEREFTDFLNSELEKVEAFYRQKEDSAGKRLAMLREQLHEMRNRRTSEIAEVRRRKHDGDSDGNHGKEDSHSNGAHIPLFDPLRAKFFRPGPNSQALQQMETPALAPQTSDPRRDYARRPVEDEVPYRTAKRKLKLALQEFYRGLELLKSYALLNRTAFRKLNKKYDKAVRARPPYRYMTEKVSKSWFVNSDVLEGHLQAVEDLYARYFERGNHKIAAGKLRSLSKKTQDESGSAFQNGIFIGIGAVFATQGLVYGAELLFDNDPVVRSQTAYLLQIYAGYFLMLYLFSLFCLDCKMWTTNRVNYPFIFEFDSRSQLDWRQLARFPSFFLFLFGLFIWINFTRYGSPDMYLYYPVILICVTFAILFCPAPILFHKSRKWFLYSHWRLFFAAFLLSLREFMGRAYKLQLEPFTSTRLFCLPTTYLAILTVYSPLPGHAQHLPPSR